MRLDWQTAVVLALDDGEYHVIVEDRGDRRLHHYLQRDAQDGQPRLFSRHHRQGMWRPLTWYGPTGTRVRAAIHRYQERLRAPEDHTRA